MLSAALEVSQIASLARIFVRTANVDQSMVIKQQVRAVLISVVVSHQLKCDCENADGRGALTTADDRFVRPRDTAQRDRS